MTLRECKLCEGGAESVSCVERSENVGPMGENSHDVEPSSQIGGGNSVLQGKNSFWSALENIALSYSLFIQVIYRFIHLSAASLRWCGLLDRQLGRYSDSVSILFRCNER